MAQNSNVVNLSQYRLRKGVNKKRIIKDSFGRDMFLFMITFNYETDTLPIMITFELWAYDFEDAEVRLESIRETGQVVAQIMS